MEKKKLLLLYSGGLDSTVLLYLAIELGYDVYCLLIDYEQKHIKELVAAATICDKLNVPYHTVVLRGLNVESKLTSGDVKYMGVSEWHVPSRNLIFIGLAASVAESKGIDLIWYGANYEDREHLFPDCYQDWVFHLNRLLERNGSSQIIVRAPLLGLTKEMTQAIGHTLKIPEKEVFSGYGDIH